jgi:hypothetical protein
MRKLRLAARELADTNRVINAKLRLDERYAKGTPDPVSTERLRPFLAEVFGDDYKYSFEYRSHVCELNVDGFDRGWMAPLQEEGGRRAMFDGEMFGDRAYLLLMEEARSRGSLLAMPLLQWLYESDAMAHCRPQSPPPYDLGVRFDLDPDERMTAVYSGALATTQVGTCVRAAIEAELTQIQVPPDTVWPMDEEVPVFR